MKDASTDTFAQLNLIAPLLEALQREGYTHPTPIQHQAIPQVLNRRDLLACAQTGTGKTAAFALPILQLLSERSPDRSATGRNQHIKVLVLAPTRELAAQIGESFDRYGADLNITNTTIFGGVGQGSQVSALRRGVDILVATPGRLLDLIEQRMCDLSRIDIFVLDEADRMLDMGFIHDVRRLLKILPKKRHSLFFSATMPRDIQLLARDILTDPVKVEVTPVATTAEKIAQSIYFVEKADKRRLLEKLMRESNIGRALVFSRTKHGADAITRYLNQSGVTAEAIHGNKSQNNRVRALNNFKEGLTRALVATDIAARGIDIDGVTHVFNYDLPNVPESYVHRIGRTARAGAEGIAISFCDFEEQAYLRDIEKLIRMKVTVVEHHLAPATAAQKTAHNESQRARPQQQQQQRSRGARTGARSGPQQGSRSGAPSGSRPQQSTKSRPSSGYQGKNRNAPSSARPTRDSASSSRSSAPRKTQEKSAPPKAAKSNAPWWKKLISSKE